MSEKFSFSVNGSTHTVTADPGMPLLYTLRDDLGLNNPHFGCGLAQCGACTEIPPSGAGEPAIRPVAAAIANAVFDATGVRIRRVPFSPDNVKSALS